LVDSFEGISGGEHGDIEDGQLAESSFGGVAVLSFGKLSGGERIEFEGRSD
jgi:hypothetical protein